MVGKNTSSLPLMLCLGGLSLLYCAPPTPAPDDAPAAGAERGVAPVMTARSLSNHYVEATFDRAVDERYGRPETYKIVSSSDGAVLAVRDARLRPGGLSVLLTTDAQQETDYVLSTVGTSLSVEETTPDAAKFTGSNKPELVLGFAVALSNTTVKLTFGEKVDATSAADPANYVISNPDLGITSATIAPGDPLNMITLTTSPQSDTDYTVKVVNLLNVAGDRLIDPDRNAATFVGIGPEDTTPPELVLAEASAVDEILLTFSEPLENFVDDLKSYDVNDGIDSVTVLAAAPTSSSTQVRLSVLPMTVDTTYFVTVTQVEDRSGNVITPPDNTDDFTYTDLDDGNPSSVLPRLTGAISIDTTTVLVTFNKPMSASAIDPDHYQIVQENFIPEAGLLIVKTPSSWEVPAPP